MSASPIAEQVDIRRAGRPAGPPSAFEVEQEQLSRFTPANVIAVGQRLPDAELLDAHGAPTTLVTALDGKAAVLVFYRGAWCPYCNIALGVYQRELLPALVARGVVLVAVSPQKPDGSLTMKEKHELTHTVLSDPHNTLATAAGILTAPTDDARTAQLEIGVDLTTVNADGTTALPMPTTVILDPEGTVRWIDVHPNYSTRTEPGDILAALDALNSES